MADIQLTLSRLRKVEKKAFNSWMALCPAHEEKTPSLHVVLSENDRILLKCFGNECSPEEILEATGLSWDAIMPARRAGEFQRGKRPFDALAVLQALGEDSTYILLYGASVCAGETPSPRDRQLLCEAVGRMQRAVSLATGAAPAVCCAPLRVGRKRATRSFSTQLQH